MQAAGNLVSVKVLGADQLNVYDVVRAQVVVVSEHELAAINEVWS
jgi:large subunit ribosomal protein L4